MSNVDRAGKDLVPISHVPGMQPLKRQALELFSQYRAQGLGRVEAYRRANQRFRGGFNKTYTDKNAYQMASVLEQKRDVAERIQYLVKNEVDAIRQQRQRIAEQLWLIHDADIGDAFEITPTGQEKPKKLSDMSPDFRKTIEKVTPDNKGNWVPQLYSKTAVSKELRALYAIGRPTEASEVSRLSDAELIQQLSDQAKELGVDIKLDYAFAKAAMVGVDRDATNEYLRNSVQPTDSETASRDSQVIDNTEDDKPKR